MNSRPGALLGVQVPRVSCYAANAVDFFDGDEAVDLARGYGLPPDVWQATTVRNWLARRADGRLAAGRCGQSVPRQNGKNANIEIVQLHKMVMQGRKILHTAHEVKTARKAFRRLASFFENPRRYPELAARVVEIRKANGQEAILLSNGGSCEFSARSRGAARGFTADDLFCDEAQELTDEQLEALLPTISAAPTGDPQQYFLGTPPSEAMAGEVFRRIRATGVEGKDRRLCWEEWSIADDMDPHEGVRRWRELAAATNPALGVRLNITTVEDEMKAMSPEGFCRERLGQWLSRSKLGPFPAGSWEGGIDASSTIAADSRLMWCVDVSGDRRTSHIAVAGLRADGRPQVEVAASRVGTAWVVDWIRDRASAESPMQVVVQERGAPASSLIDELRQLDHVSVLPWGGADLGNATARLFDLVRDGALAHLPQPVLDVAAASAVPRILSDGGMAWDRRRSPVDIAPLVAATGALWFLLQPTETAFRSAYEDGDLVVV